MAHITDTSRWIKTVIVLIDGWGSCVKHVDLHQLTTILGVIYVILQKQWSLFPAQCSDKRAQVSAAIIVNTKLPWQPQMKCDSLQWHNLGKSGHTHRTMRNGHATILVHIMAALLQDHHPPPT